MAPARLKAQIAPVLQASRFPARTTGFSMETESMDSHKAGGFGDLLDCEQSLFFFGIVERAILITRVARNRNSALHYPKEK